jgi:uncharacterized protein YcfL
MKKLAFITLLALAFVSCKSNSDESEAPSRIHVIESSFAASTHIVEVDGHEYLVNYHGGIVHLESCPCKNK